MNKLDEKINNEKFKLQELREWINNVDIKASIALAFIGIMFVDIIKNLNINIIYEFKNMNIINITLISFIKIIMSLCIYILPIVSIFYLLKCLYAKIDISIFSKKGLMNKSLYFFGSISKHEFLEYKNDVLNGNDNNVLNDMISQVYINSNICDIKFKLFNKGIKFTLVSIIIFIICKLAKIM